MLSGVQIVEIEGLGPGPFAAMLLADLGAEVIVVHRAGKNAIAPGPLDRGKRSIVLDLKDPGDLSVAKALIATADGLIEGFRPGVMERLGLGPADCHAVRPQLVYGRMTGWGQTGPRAQQAGHDLNCIALAGALWHASPAGTPPFTPPTLVGDIGGGALYLVIGILAGLLNARASGRGTVVDAAIVDGTAHMMALLVSLVPQGAPLPARGAGLLDGPHWSRCYICADGGYISVQSLEPKFYTELVDRLGFSDDGTFASQHDPATWPKASARLAACFAARPRDHWTALFEGSDACVVPVLDPAEAAVDPHMAARAVWQQAQGRLQPRPAPCFDGRAAPIRAAPARDADGAALRAELGI